MMYYILLPDDTDEGVQYSTNILGESSFKNFWADQGFDIFERLVHKYPDTLDEIKIKDEKGKQYTPEEFLNSHQHTHTHLYNNITENLHTHSHIHRYINGTLVRSHAHLYNSIYSLITFEPTSYKHTHIHTHLYKNISNNTHEHNHSHTYTPDGKLLKDHVHSFGESIIFSPLVTKSYNNIIGFNTTDKSNNSSNNCQIVPKLFK